MPELYFAYGANTNFDEMSRRCPVAKPFGTATLDGFRLCFKRAADIEPRVNKQVRGVLWYITERCRQALDRFEGYPLVYTRKQLSVQPDSGKRRLALTYLMTPRNFILPPDADYLQCLREGYAHFGLPDAQLNDALEHAEHHVNSPLDWNDY